MIEKHWDILDKAASTMMSLIAEAGNAKSDYFAQTFEPVANNTYRLIMYPNREEKDIPKGAFLPDGRSKSILSRIQLHSDIDTFPSNFNSCPSRFRLFDTFANFWLFWA